MKEIIIKAPEGQKKIKLIENDYLKIYLEDLEKSPRNFNHQKNFYLEIDLIGDNARCDIEGRIYSTNISSKKWEIVQIFRGKNQVGKINIQGVADNQGKLSLKAEGILTSESKQATILINEKVLLFEQAKSELLPILTVKTDNVKQAKHSASVAPIKSENLLFLTSRGIPLKEAENILKKGFLK